MRPIATEPMFLVEREPRVERQQVETPKLTKHLDEQRVRGVLTDRASRRRPRGFMPHDSPSCSSSITDPCTCFVRQQISRVRFTGTSRRASQSAQSHTRHVADR